MVPAMKSFAAHTDGGQDYPVIAQVLAPDLDDSPLDEGQNLTGEAYFDVIGRPDVDRLRRRNARPSDVDGIIVGRPRSGLLAFHDVDGRSGSRTGCTSRNPDFERSISRRW